MSGAIATVAADLAAAQALSDEKPTLDIRATTTSIMARCLAIISNPTANEADRKFALDIAYDQGHQVGYSEALEAALRKFDTAVAKVGT